MNCDKTFQTTLKETVDCFKENNTINDDTVDECLLPIFHVTTYKNFMQILESRKLQAKNEDKLFNEKIIFFSYGKMSYIPKPLTEVQVLNINQLPIALIFEPDSYRRITFDKLVCIDSGALMDNRFSEFKPNINDVVIDTPKREDIVIAVKSLYGNITNYINNNTDVLIGMDDKSQMSLISKLAKLFENLPNEKVHSGIDQATTFELHKKDSFELTPDKVLIPRINLTVSKKIESIMNTIRDKFDDNKIEFLVYYTNREPMSNSLLINFQELAKKYIKTYEQKKISI